MSKGTVRYGGKEEIRSDVNLKKCTAKSKYAERSDGGKS